MKKAFRVFVNRNPMFDKCPGCKQLGTLHRSKARNLKENLIKSFSIWKLYRCKSCGWRGYRSVIIITARSFLTLFYYCTVIIIVAYIVMKVLSNYNQ